MLKTSFISNVVFHAHHPYKSISKLLKQICTQHIKDTTSFSQHMHRLIKYLSFFQILIQSNNKHRSHLSKYEHPTKHLYQSTKQAGFLSYSTDVQFKTLFDILIEVKGYNIVKSARLQLWYYLYLFNSFLFSDKLFANFQF